MTEEKRLGRYEIVRELGRGGMGIVLEGRDPMIDRPVALKIIKLSEMGSAMEEKELKERFFIEAKAAGRLIHPHIVTIYDVGEEEGKSFMAMEFVEGEDLAGIITDEGPIPLARAAKIVAQIADGLAYAHEHHIVHRDIKPGNILITRGDRVKITDFGLARLTTTAGSVTQTGHAVGSPSYMSPEQVQGHAIDGRSDLFSLGVLFYELVTGRRPFVGEGLTNIIFKIIQDNPPLVSTVNPKLPKSLDRVVEKLLAKRPDERYRNGHEVANALAPFTGAVEEEGEFGATMDMATAGKTIDFESDKILEFSHEQKKGSGALIGGVIVATMLLVGGTFYAIKESRTGAPAPTPTRVAETAPTPTPTSTPTPTPTPTPTEEAPAKEAEKPAVAQPASLTVTPSVAGTLFIDGTKVGDAPVKGIETVAGKHQLKVTADGYDPWEVGVDLAPGEEARFAPKLTLAPASLMITSTPAEVAVSLDDKPVGKTPLVIPSLKPGAHALVLSGKGLVAAKRSVTISAEEPTTLAVTMTADTGTVAVAGPKGAAIYIDGKKQGTAPTTLTLLSGGAIRWRWRKRATTPSRSLRWWNGERR